MYDYIHEKIITVERLKALFYQLENAISKIIT